MKADGIQFSLGFMKSTAAWPFGSARSFGSPGAGGSLGFADPEAGIGYAYVTSQMGTALTGDPRDVALRDALYSTHAESLRHSAAVTSNREERPCHTLWGSGAKSYFRAPRNRKINR